MEVVETVPATQPSDDQRVMRVVRKGFRLFGEVLQQAKVVVAQTTLTKE
jgi:molecular chaperone GrpE (heat shock protein)